MYILITGKAGVGKTTVARILCGLLKEYDNCVIDSFAVKLKKIAYDIGWNGEKDKKGRKLLQSLGKLGRDYDEDTWVRVIYDYHLGDPGFIIIDDWRFLNEYLYLKHKDNIFTIKIEAYNRELLKNTALYNDISERALDTVTDIYNVIINNTGSMDDLNKQIKEVYNE